MLMQNETTDTPLECVTPRRAARNATPLAPLSQSRPAIVGGTNDLVKSQSDAMKQVDGTRELKLSSKADTGGVVVCVADTGIGLPPETNRVFEAFFTTKSDGMGMGLAISRTIIESHGGSLRASSNPGRGAVFSFILPVAAARASA